MKPTRSSMLIVCIASLSLNSSLLWAQQPTPRHSSEPAQASEEQEPTPEQEEPIALSARLINVFFSVTDKRNAFITDIKQEEVEVLENGKPQDIFMFAKETDLPLTIALLIDVSGSEQYTLPAEKFAASRFFQSIVRPNLDVVAIVQFRDEVILVQDFTSTMDRLEQGLEKVRYIPRTTTDITSTFGGTSLYDAIYIACDELLARQAGRRTIILLTDGEDTTSVYKLPDAIERAFRSEVTVFSIGIGDSRFGGVNRGVLRKLSHETGGRAYFPRDPDELVGAFREIEQELRSQYLLAYSPTNAGTDGGFRKIEIRIPGRKDLRVRHRQGYYAPGETK